jgi:hypothetical protein
MTGSALSLWKLDNTPNWRIQYSGAWWGHKCVDNESQDSSPGGTSHMVRVELVSLESVCTGLTIHASGGMPL